MNNKLINKFYHPILYFFLLPLISLLFGSLFASQYTMLRPLMLIPFYFFILVNQLMENILLRIPKSDFELSKKLLILLESLNLALILFFTWHYSFIAGLTLFLYTLTIQMQFLFSYYDLETTAAFIASFLKVMLLNGFAFYIHTDFMNFSNFLDYGVIFIPYLIYELARIHTEPSRPAVKFLVSLSYLIALSILWPKISFFSLLLLLTLPLLWPSDNVVTRKETAIFLVNFSLFYAFVLIGSIFL